MMTLANMRVNGVRSLFVSCGTNFCWHSASLNVDGYSDDLTVPSFGPRMVCTGCGAVCAEVRPDWSERMQTISFHSARR